MYNLCKQSTRTFFTRVIITNLGPVNTGWQSADRVVVSNNPEQQLCRAVDRIHSGFLALEVGQGQRC